MWDSLENAGSSFAHATKDTTVQLVDHKYGSTHSPPPSLSAGNCVADPPYLPTHLFEGMGTKQREWWIMDCR